MFNIKKTTLKVVPVIGAGDGNRTHVISLEGWSSTIELHPHRMAVSYTPLNKMSRKM